MTPKASLGVLLLTLSSATLFAQDTPPSAWARGTDLNAATSSSTAQWLGAWSPLRPIVDLPRGLLRAPLAPGLLDAPAPMAGAFVLAGSPGALARDLRPQLVGDTARFSELRFRVAGESGSYRRPLDVAESQVSSVSGLGWSPVGARGIAIGRFVIDHENNPVASYAERLMPYVSSPFVATDSVMPPMQRTRARVEGALGLRLGQFGVGLSAGLDTRDYNSVDVPLRRAGHASTPGFVAGVDRELPWHRLRVGGYYRWAESNETNLLNAVPLPTVIYGLQGYDEPFGFLVGAASPVLVRIDRRATAVGGTGELTVLDTRVVLTHESGSRAEDQYRNVFTRVRPTDRWRASGSETRIMAQRLVGARARFTLVGSMESLTGHAVRSDLTGIAMDGSDERNAVEADIRMTVSPRWSVAVSPGVTRVITQRTDYVASIRSRIDATTPFASSEVARAFGRTSVSLGASMAFTSPSGRIPVATRGPNYQRLIAPALAYDVASARAYGAFLSAVVRMRQRTLVLSVRSEQTTPTTIVTRRLQPGGDRTLWNVVVGWRP